MGAGAVAVGGVISLLRAAPLIWRSIYANVRGAFLSKTSLQERRTDESISMKWVLIGIIAIMTAISLAEPLHMNIVGAALIAIVGFLFSGVSSRLTGQIGSSSNPISGLTVGTLLLTCLIFLALGWTGSHYYVTALSVGAIVCVAASNAGATSQDLKTGFLVGSTPRMQQYAILIGALSSALILGPILLKLNDASTVYVPAKELSNLPQVDSRTLNERAVLTGPQALSDSRSYFVWRHKDGKYLVDEEGHIAYLVDPGINGSFTHRPDGSEVQKFSAPKAVLISYIIKGILDQHLPWALVLFGVMIALILEMSGVSSLAFAVGVYLPLASTMPIFVGGMVRWFSDRRRNASHYATSDQSSGVLLASGYIAGGALAGIVIAIMTGALTPFNDAVTQWAMQHNPFYEGVYANVLSLLPYGALVVLLYWVGRHVK
jgi:uncharacterized oligopeptide transporter (OPT) family protein